MHFNVYFNIILELKFQKRCLPRSPPPKLKFESVIIKKGIVLILMIAVMVSTVKKEGGVLNWLSSTENSNAVKELNHNATSVLEMKQRRFV